jgi:hypothetical protein
MTSKSRLQLFASAMTLGALFVGAGAAHAGVESMHKPRDPDKNCDEPHHVRAPGLIWTPADGTLRINGTGPEKYEFYGQLMDMAPSAEIEGFPGARASRVQGHAGPINAARGCGNIGSIVIELTLPNVTRETSGTLLIGLERIPFVAVPRQMDRASWHGSNVDDSPEPEPTRSGGGSSSSGSLPPPPPPPTVSGSPSSCSGVGCPAPGNSLQFLPSTGMSTTGTSSMDISTVSECMDAYGGMAQVNGSRLTVTLPRRRSAASLRCFNQYFLIHAGSSARNVHEYMGTTSRIVPTYQISNPSDGPQMTGRTHRDSTAFHTMSLQPDPIATLVGEYRYTVSVGPAPSPNPLEMILRSDPAYGVKRIVSPQTRMTANPGLTVHPYQRVKPGERFFWRITSATSGMADRCFSETQGVVSPPSGAETFLIPTEADSLSTCRQPFSITVKPAAFENDAEFDNGLFGKTLNFTPATNTTVIAQPPGPTITPRVPIRVPPGL